MDSATAAITTIALIAVCAAFTALLARERL
jgi:hypothetical protein